jgi:putative sigma-54 modulation protein
MQITITARHFDLTKAIREHVEEACEKLDKYFDQIINLHLTLSHEHGRNTVEFQLHASHFSLTTETEEHDMYLAIDTAIEKMEVQIKRLKDRVTDHSKKRHDDTHFSYANLLERNVESGRPRRVVKTKRMEAESLTLNEAINRFEEIEDPYLIFLNVETDKINVLVKKDEEHYRLIEP